MSKTAIIYGGRVSTAEQKDRGHSLPEQISSLRGYCNHNDIRIIKEYQEDYSAKNFTRPQFTELFQYLVKNNREIDYVLVQRWDRFIRNSSLGYQMLDTLMAIGIEVNAIDQWIDHDVPEQATLLAIYLSTGQVENRVKSLRVKEGNYSALKTGRYINMQPRGYVKGLDEDGRPLMKICPENGPIVASLLRDYASGKFTQQEIIDKYNNSTFKLSKSTLSRMLRNVLYKGVVRVPRHKENEEAFVNGLHDPLITKSEFHAIQKLLESKNNRIAKSNTDSIDMPLRGMLQCPECGGNMTGSRSGGNGGVYHYYLLST